MEVDGVVHSTLSPYAMTNQQVGKTSLEEGEEGKEVLREASSMLSLGTCAKFAKTESRLLRQKHLPEFIALAFRWIRIIR